MMPPQAVWELELPDLPFTAADLVGRYFRNTRLNWKPLIMLFVVPSFLYEVARSVLTWIAGHSAKVSGGWLVFLACFCLLILALTKLSICVRYIAVQYLLSGHAQDLGAAMSLSRRKYGLAALLIAPVVVGDLTETALSCGYLATIHSQSNQMTAALLYYAYLLMAFPYLATCVLNGFFIALIIRRNLTVVQAMRRFAYVLTRWTGFVIGYTVLSVIVYFAISLSATLIGLVEMVPALFSGQAREFLVFVTAFISSCLEAPVGAFVYATVPLSGAYLDYQSGVVLEGADLQNKLSKLRR
jgi:hypothetical protein